MPEDKQNNTETYGPINEQELLLRLNQGDCEAFSTIYKRYWEDLFVTATKVLEGKEEAADVVQDIFVSLWKRRTELNITTSLAAYLHMSVRYKCVHYIEKHITKRNYLVRLAETSERYFSENIHKDIQLKELQLILHKVINEMPPRMQEVYKLSRHECLSHKEIARLLSISPETVKKHIQHALNHIKAALVSRALIIAFFFLDAFA